MKVYYYIKYFSKILSLFPHFWWLLLVCQYPDCIWMKTRLLLVIWTEGLNLTFISIQNGSIQRGSFLIWAWIRLQIGNDSNGSCFVTSDGSDLRIGPGSALDRPFLEGLRSIFREVPKLGIRSCVKHLTQFSWLANWENIYYLVSKSLCTPTNW